MIRLNLERKIVNAFTTVACPSAEEFAEAKKIVHRRNLHVYQRFHELGYAYVNDPAVKVEAFPTGDWGCTYRDHKPFSAGSIAELIDKLELLMVADQEAKKKPFNDSCCSLEVPRFCVCARPTFCPVHGNICRGSHE